MSKPPTARRVALDALDAIDPGGAYANVASRTALAAGRLSDRDRHFVTELVHGTTRMRRACDHVVDRFLERSVSDRVRNVLRMGAYQLVFLRTADHAAVSETVDVAPKPARGLVNAVLRKIASLPDDLEWPDLATELSYPTWIVERLTVDLGADRAEAALRTMNQAPSATERDDGYTQDLASQWVARAGRGGSGGAGSRPLCRAREARPPRWLSAPATVIAADRREHRVATIVENVDRLGLTVPAVVADGAAPPFRRRGLRSGARRCAVFGTRGASTPTRCTLAGHPGRRRRACRGPAPARRRSRACRSTWRCADLFGVHVDRCRDRRSRPVAVMGGAAGAR